MILIRNKSQFQLVPVPRDVCTGHPVRHDDAHKLVQVRHDVMIRNKTTLVADWSTLF